MPAASNVPWRDAVTQDGDPVGDAEHLRQSMADVDDADPGAALLEHERVEALHLLGPEGRRRLVQEQDLRPGEQRLDHLEQLPLGQRQRAMRAAAGTSSSNSPSCLGRPLLHGSVGGSRPAGTAR